MQSLILMTSFNGEKYICEQIESICKQTLKDWHLLIRDDGSSDKTIDIIRSFMAKDSRIELIKNETEQHGAYLNFWTLIEYAKALPAYDYYFFADQDDVWREMNVEHIPAEDVDVLPSGVDWQSRHLESERRKAEIRDRIHKQAEQGQKTAKDYFRPAKPTPSIYDSDLKGRYEAEKNAVIISLEKDEREC